MKKIRFLLGIVMALACAKLASAGPAQDSDDTLLRWHFSGLGAFGNATNYSHLQKVLALATSQTLQKEVVGKLAAASGEIFQGGGTTKSQAQLLTPLWEDLLNAESLGDWRQHGSAGPEFVSLIKLTEERAALWNRNLRRALAGWGAPPTDLPDGGWTAGLGPRANLRFSRQGDWVVLSYGRDEAVLNHEWVRQAKSGQAPESFTDNLEWLAADVNWPRIEKWIPGALGPLKPARTRVYLRMKGETVRTQVSLRYPQNIPWEGREAAIPELIRWPLTSFSVLHDLRALLKPAEIFQRLGYDPLAGDLFVWAQTDLKSQTFLLARVDDAKSSLETLSTKAPAVFNPLLASWQWGELAWSGARQSLTPLVLPGAPAAAATNPASPPQFALRFTGLPALEPILIATNDTTGQYLFSKFFIPMPEDHPLPEGLARQARAGSDLVYYDWEITQLRLEQWRLLRNLLPLFAINHATAPLQTDETEARLTFEEKWLEDVTPLLGESVSEIRRTSPTEFSFTRKSFCGFTAVELVYLAHWLSSPSFPVAKQPSRHEAPPKISPAAPSQPRPAR